MRTTRISWDHGTWTNPPASSRQVGDALVVGAVEGSDYWERTLYGFQHDSGHGLLAPWPDGRAVEVTFDSRELTGLYDQAGLLLWRDGTHWVKAGVEINDGVPHVGAVVTDGCSDWSLSPVPDWQGRPVTIRASRHGDAVIIRARAGDEPWRTIRVAPFAPDVPASAGPFTCAPTRAGLTVTFTGWRHTAADSDLHTDPPVD